MRNLSSNNVNEKELNYEVTNNCFSLLRLIFALQIFFGHSCLQLNIQLPTIACKIREAVYFGVPAFFVISGFCIYNSLRTKQYSFLKFAKKRVLRLYPELWMAVILNAIVMIILYRKNIKMIPFVLFQLTQSTIFQFWTPKILRGYGCGTPNGSLWTISVMVQCYIVLYFVWMTCKRKKGALISWFVFFAIVNIFTPALQNVQPELVFKLVKVSFIPHMWLFLLGAIVCEYFEVIIAKIKQVWWIFALVLIVFRLIGMADLGVFGFFDSIVETIVLIGIGYTFCGIKIKYDVSYEIYLFHMIVVNAMIHLGYVNHIKYFGIAFLITIPIAIIAYFLNKIFGHYA